MKSAIVFDVDNTLTPPRKTLREEMAKALKALTHHFVLAACPRARESALGGRQAMTLLIGCAVRADDIREFQRRPFRLYWLLASTDAWITHVRPRSCESLRVVLLSAAGLFASGRPDSSFVLSTQG